MATAAKPIPSTAAPVGAASKDRSHWLTQVQALDMLGVSVNTLYRYQREGKLNPTKGRRSGSRREILIYDPEELARVMPRARDVAVVHDPEGESVARVFEMLDTGASIRHIVVTLRVTPDKVEALRERWLDAGGSALVISDDARAEIERYVGPFESTAELVTRIAEKAGATITAEVPDGATDGDIEDGITAALNAAGG